MDSAAQAPVEASPASTVYYDASDVERPRPRPRASGFGGFVALVGVLALAAWVTSRMVAGSGEGAPPEAPVPVASATPVVLPVVPTVTPDAVAPVNPPVAVAPKVETKADPRAPGKPDPKVEPKVEPPPDVKLAAKADTPVASTPVEPPPAAPIQQCIKDVDAPGEVKIGGSVAFKASLCRDGDVTLKYRAVGSERWYTKQMVKRVGAWFALINVDDAFATGIDWYVVSEGASKGSAAAPRRITVTP
jgi:hypothetical protein